jgi:hypothetical protein
MAKGLYKPLHPEKYLGDPTKIRFLSSWEMRFMNFCDNNPNVIAWGSEEIKIGYYNPIKKKFCTYLPDFIVKYKNERGQVITEVVEIKPMKESKQRAKMSIYDKAMLITNHAKWKAAGAFCAKAGIKFRVLTEQGSILIGADGNPLQESEKGLFRR